MEKSELKNGAVLELRDGTRFLKVDNTLLKLTMSGEYAKLDDFKDNLLSNNCSRHDIMKVNNNVNINKDKCSMALIKLNLYEEWTWERKEEILDEAEKAYLSAVIKPFRNRVISIILKELVINSYIEIDIKQYDNKNLVDYIRLPFFKNNTMYKCLQADEPYTLEELGL